MGKKSKGSKSSSKPMAASNANNDGVSQVVCVGLGLERLGFGHKVLDFISTMLFCIGSVFYMMLSTMVGLGLERLGFGSANNDGGLEKFTGIRLPVDYANCLHGSRSTFSAGLPLTVEKFMSAYSKALSQVLRKYNRQDQVKVSVMWKEVMDLIPPNLQIHIKESASALLSVLVHYGEMLLLEGGADGAYIIAHTILATDVKSGGIDSVIYNSQLRDLMSSGDNLREITKFYHTRSGCHCLEETYAHLRRTDEKQGLCYQCQAKNERKSHTTSQMIQFFTCTLRYS
jgi:hypothetical protein